MRKDDKKFCRKRVKRIVSYLKKTYPFDYAQKFSHSDFSPRCFVPGEKRYTLGGEEDGNRIILNLDTKGRCLIITMNLIEYDSFTEETILKRSYDIMTGESFNQIKFDIVVLEQHMYKAHARQRKLNNLLLL